MKLYLNLKNAWKIFILVFILSSCSDIGGIVEIAVKDSVTSHLDSKEIIQSIDNTNIATSSKEKITQNNTNIQTLHKVIASPRYKIGDPYEIKNIWYYPKRDLTYEETGIASWYGKEFHGKLTANGEIFNKDIINYFEVDHKNLKKIVFFGIASAVALTVHSIFLGIKFDNDLYKLFRRVIMLSFIIFEIVAQAYLVATFWSFKEKLKGYINPSILNLKITLVSILIIVAVISIPIISLPGDDFFGIQLKFLKHALEWDFFIGVITFYLLTFFMWKKLN